MLGVLALPTTLLLQSDDETEQVAGALLLACACLGVGEAPIPPGTVVVMAEAEAADDTLPGPYYQ
jgi:hypothetical protein